MAQIPKRVHWSSPIGTFQRCQTVILPATATSVTIESVGPMTQTARSYDPSSLDLFQSLLLFHVPSKIVKISFKNGENTHLKFLDISLLSFINLKATRILST